VAVSQIYLDINAKMRLNTIYLSRRLKKNFDPNFNSAPDPKT
jgi:hypothetical protein